MIVLANLYIYNEWKLTFMQYSNVSECFFSQKLVWDLYIFLKYLRINTVFLEMSPWPYHTITIKKIYLVYIMPSTKCTQFIFCHYRELASHFPNKFKEQSFNRQQLEKLWFFQVTVTVSLSFLATVTYCPSSLKTVKKGF